MIIAHDADDMHSGIQLKGDVFSLLDEFTGIVRAMRNRPGSTMPVYAGTGLSGVGAMFYVYTMMSFTGDAIDHVEYSQGIRVEGLTAGAVKG